MCRVGDDADVVADDPFRRFFIVDIHGAGDNIVCVGLTGCVVLRLPLTITTLHRLVIRRITALVDSISFACYDVVDAERDSGLAIRIVGERFCEAVRTRLVRSKKPASIRLPFGLTLEGPVAPIVHIEEADADSCDDSCGFTLAPEASTTGASLSGTDTDVHPPPVVVAPPPALAARAPRVGLIAFEVAPSSRASCFVCSERIQAGDWRFDYQLKPTRTFSDMKRVHPRCVPHLPDATKETDYRFLVDCATRPDLVAAHELLETLADARRPHAVGAASSGGV